MDYIFAKKEDIMGIMKARLQKSTLVYKHTANPGWLMVDADGQILGRLATKIAMILMGKHKPEYTPSVDTGDFVIVTNAARVRVTGDKAATKTYASYSYYPGGLKTITYREMMQRHPERILAEAVRRMLPKNKLGRQMFKKLKVYAGADHPHAAQQPQTLNVN